MGLFDSSCLVTGLSLKALDRVACVPLVAEGDHFRARGPVVFGASNRGGGIDGADAVAEPYALAVRCGVVTGLDLSPFVLVESDGASALGALEGPLAAERSAVFVGSGFGERPAWVRDDVDPGYRSHERPLLDDRVRAHALRAHR